MDLLTISAVILVGVILISLALMARSVARKNSEEVRVSTAAHDTAQDRLERAVGGIADAQQGFQRELEALRRGRVHQ